MRTEDTKGKGRLSLKRDDREAMAYLFRSEDMQYVQITTQKDKAEFVVRRIGELGLLHIVNVSTRPSHQSEDFFVSLNSFCLQAENSPKI